MPQHPAIPRFRPRSEAPKNQPTKKLKRKRCLNCGALFPLTKDTRKFCKDECRKQFHKFGAAYGPLKANLEKLIDHRVQEATRELQQTIARHHAQIETVIASLPLEIDTKKIIIKMGEPVSRSVPPRA